MKDKKARETIKGLEAKIKELRDGLGWLKDFTIRQCPKCKHLTPQQKGWEHHDWAHDLRAEFASECLVCGSGIPWEKELPSREEIVERQQKHIAKVMGKLV